MRREVNHSLNAPIADAMKIYSDDRALAFHTPGHKQGRGAHQLLKDLITTEGLRREVSLMDELDDLHDPRGAIDEAQRLAANLWHADHTIFFINGTTAAVQTMILSTVGEGDIIFVPRNAHRCVNSALVLSGARPIYLAPDFDHDFDIALNVSLSTVKQAVEKFPTPYVAELLRRPRRPSINRRVLASKKYFIARRRSSRRTSAVQRSAPAVRHGLRRRHRRAIHS